jgi:hypothetical protein
MKILLRRDQRSGMLGKQVFSLDVRADIDDAERAAIAKYRLGDTLLYSSHEERQGRSMSDMARGGVIGGAALGALEVAQRLAHKAITLQITVNDLAMGKRIECKDIVEMIAIEEQIREAARTFKDVLNAAMHFGGEEVLELV